LIGAVGRAREPLATDTPGHIDVHGEIWRARSRASVPAGARVRIVAIDGLTLTVEPSDPPPQGEHA
jgi:membrane-bound serine protease (ClpP class)